MGFMSYRDNGEEMEITIRDNVGVLYYQKCIVVSKGLCAPKGRFPFEDVEGSGA